MALSRATNGSAAVLRRALAGPVNDALVERVCGLLVEIGAVDAVEEHIDVLVTSGLAALDRTALDPEAKRELVRLAGKATVRKA